MPAKIKIVDVVDKDVENDAYIVANIEEKDEGTTQEVTVDTATTEPTKKIRNQELVQCDKCKKWVTPKTLKYTHSLKCGVEKYQPGRPKKSEIKITENVQEEAPSPPPPPPPPEPTPAVQKVVKDKPPPVPRTQPPKTVVKEVVKTFEEMRRERLTERLKQRAERNINLFKQVL